MPTFSARSSLSLPLLLLACRTPALTTPAPPLATRSLAILGGSADTTHTSVVSVVAQTGVTPELCTGTVIAPRVVLTAGHCTLGQSAAALVVGVGPSAGSPTSTLAVVQVLTYPEYEGTDDLPGGTDLGALILAEDACVPSVPLFSGDASTLVGDDVTVVGYGQSSASDLESSGTRLSAVMGVSAACSALLSFGDATTNACHGDSGGPLLVVGDGGVASIAAVVSYGDEMNCATPTRAVRLDRYASWIADVIAGAASGDAGACAACPTAAIDCEPDDGGSDAESAEDAAVVDASVPRTVSSSPAGGSGGCEVQPTRDPPFTPLAIAVALVLYRRRRARPACDSR